MLASEKARICWRIDDFFDILYDMYGDKILQHDDVLRLYESSDTLKSIWCEDDIHEAFNIQFSQMMQEKMACIYCNKFIHIHSIREAHEEKFNFSIDILTIIDDMPQQCTCDEFSAYYRTQFAEICEKTQHEYTYDHCGLPEHQYCIFCEQRIKIL